MSPTPLRKFSLSHTQRSTTGPASKVGRKSEVDSVFRQQKREEDVRDLEAKTLATDRLNLKRCERMLLLIEELYRNEEVPALQAEIALESLRAMAASGKDPGMIHAAANQYLHAWYAALDEQRRASEQSEGDD